MRRWLGRLGPLLLADLDRALVIALGLNLVPYRDEGRREERTRLAALYAAGGRGRPARRSGRSTVVNGDLAEGRSDELMRFPRTARAWYAVGSVSGSFR